MWGAGGQAVCEEIVSKGPSFIDGHKGGNGMVVLDSNTKGTVLWRDCDFRNVNGDGAIYSSGHGKAVFRRSYFENCAMTGIRCGGDSEVHDCVVLVDHNNQHPKNDGKYYSANGITWAGQSGKQHGGLIKDTDIIIRSKTARGQAIRYNGSACDVTTENVRILMEADDHALYSLKPGEGYGGYAPAEPHRLTLTDVHITCRGGTRDAVSLRGRKASRVKGIQLDAPDRDSGIRLFESPDTAIAGDVRAKQVVALESCSNVTQSVGSNPTPDLPRESIPKSPTDPSTEIPENTTEVIVSGPGAKRGKQTYRLRYRGTVYTDELTEAGTTHTPESDDVGRYDATVWNDGTDEFYIDGELLELRFMTGTGSATVDGDSIELPYVKPESEPESPVEPPTDPVTPTEQSVMVADYNFIDGFRGSDDRVVVDRLVDRLTELGVSTFYMLIWHKSTDLDDLKLLLPKAAAAGIDVRAYLVPPTETPLVNFADRAKNHAPPYTQLIEEIKGERTRFQTYSEPFKLDYVRWGKELAALSNKHENFQGMAIDDFGGNIGGGAEFGTFSTEYMAQITEAINGENPDFEFEPLLYRKDVTRRFLHDYRPYIDRIIFAYPKDAAAIRDVAGMCRNEFVQSDALQVTFPKFTTSAAGDYAFAEQTARVTDAKNARIRFGYGDNFDGSTAGYHTMQLRVDGVVVWEQDVAGLDDGMADVDIAGAVAGKESVTIQLGVFDKKAVGNFTLKADLWGFEADGLSLSDPSLSPSGGWTVLTRGAFRARLAAGHKDADDIPVVTMPAVVKDEHERRHSTAGTPETMASHVRFCLEAVEAGVADGVVLYGLDKRSTSNTFGPVKREFEAFRNRYQPPTPPTEPEEPDPKRPDGYTAITIETDHENNQPYSISYEGELVEFPESDTMWVDTANKRVNGFVSKGQSNILRLRGNVTTISGPECVNVTVVP